MTLEAALTAYLNYLAGRNLSALHLSTVRSRLRAFVGNRPLGPVADVSALDLYGHFQRLEDTRADGTMAGYASTHRAFWNWCVDQGLIATSPAANLKHYSYDPHHRRAASRPHVAAVTAALPGFVAYRDNHPRDVRDALAVSICLDCGGRIGEVRSLRRRALEIALASGEVTPNGRTRHIIVGRGKTGAANLVFFEETAVLARLWLEVSPWPGADHVFISLKSGRLLRRESMSRCFDRICDYANVPKFRSHAIRKRNASDLQQMFGDPELTRQYLGHSTIAVTMKHYNDFEQNRVGDAAAEVASMRRGDPLDKLFKPRG